MASLRAAYRKVVNGQVTDEIEYPVRDQRSRATLLPRPIRVRGQGQALSRMISSPVRHHERIYRHAATSEVDYMDVSPKQVVSVAAALVPFLEHDDANRALMGSNMQRQAVPTLEVSTSRWSVLAWNVTWLPIPASA
jgi:DNA-directed RNA polymerase subunit beta